MAAATSYTHTHSVHKAVHALAACLLACFHSMPIMLLYTCLMLLSLLMVTDSHLFVFSWTFFRMYTQCDEVV